MLKIYYLLTEQISTYGILSYAQSNSLVVEDFCLGVVLSNSVPFVTFNVESKRRLSTLKKANLIDSSSGPCIVRENLKNVIENICPNEVDFIPIVLTGVDADFGSFFAINPLEKIDCVDLQDSEYELTNFDPNDPNYSFLYTKLKDDCSEDQKIGWCLQNRSYIVVNEEIFQNCQLEKIKGLRFCRAIDLTYGERTVCHTI